MPKSLNITHLVDASAAVHTELTRAGRAAPAPSIAFKDRLYNLPQYILPQRLLTRFVYRLTRARTPWFKDLLIGGFIKLYKVDMSEALEPDPSRYPDFNYFFTRALRPDARPLAAGDNVLLCPIDGAVSQIWTIEEDAVLQAKGQRFSLTQLLGGDPQDALPFQGGSFATLYLSPRDYHRIHMPIAGRLREMVHIPGKLFSVSPLTTRVVPGLFARNERVAALFDTIAGPMAIVLVGAICVASIETVWAGVITPPLGVAIRRWQYPASGEPAVFLERGAELGRFNMGSTVIVLFGKDRVRWDSALCAERAVWMGQRLGEVC